MLYDLLSGVNSWFSWCYFAIFSPAYTQTPVHVVFGWCMSVVERLNTGVNVVIEWIIQTGVERSYYITILVFLLWLVRIVVYWWCADGWTAIPAPPQHFWQRFHVSYTGVVPVLPPTPTPGLRQHPNYLNFSFMSIFVHVTSIVSLAMLVHVLYDNYLMYVVDLKRNYATPWWVRGYMEPELLWESVNYPRLSKGINYWLSWLPVLDITYFPPAVAVRARLDARFVEYDGYQWSSNWCIDQGLEFLTWFAGYFRLCFLVGFFGRVGPVLVYTPDVPIFHDNLPLRTLFRRFVAQPPARPSRNHSHPRAAVERNAANDTIDDLIRASGFVPYSFQMSRTDVQRAQDGCLATHWPGDCHSPPRSDPVNAGHIIKIVNVDYYIDPTDFFWTGQPILMYTFTPPTPAGTADDYKWTTINRGTVQLEIRGVTPFRHKLWDYNCSHLMRRIGGLTYTYTVECSPASPEWSYVLLTPCAVTGAYRGTKLRSRALTMDVETCSSRLIKLGLDRAAESNAIARKLKPPTILASAITTVAAMQHTDASWAIATPGAYTSVVVPSHLVETIRNQAALGNLVPHDLMSIIGRQYIDVDNDARTAQSIIHTCLPLTGVAPTSIPTKKKSDEDIHYRKITMEPGTTKETLTGHKICQPVIDAGYMPMRSAENDRWTVKGRLEDVRNNKTPPPRYNKYQGEFLECLIPHPHRLIPITCQQVVDAQTRPTQVANNQQAMPGLTDFMVALRDMVIHGSEHSNMLAWLVQSFQKGEVSKGPDKAPRNISTVPTEHCLLFSKYTRPFSDHLKTQPWYAFGMHPDDVARRVHALVSGAGSVVETDFSSFDGTHSHYLYDFELAVLLRGFHPQFHNEIREIHKSMTTAKARTGFGIAYDPDGSRLSGAADTSCMNSTDNAFVTFCAYRESGLTPAAAYAKLGLYGGDDGLSVDMVEKTYESTVNDIGLILKAISRLPTRPVGFLGRVYPNPAGSPAHIADVPRQLKKLHIVPTRDPLYINKPHVALYNRALSILVTDPQTPILADWARAMIRLTPDDSRIRDTRLDSWCSQLFDGRHTLIPSPLMMSESVCSQLGITNARMLEYCQHLAELKSVDDIVPLYSVPPPMPPPMVQLGEVLGPIPSDGKRTTDVVIRPTVPALPTRAPPALPVWATCAQCACVVPHVASKAKRLCAACLAKRTPVRGESAEARARKVALLRAPAMSVADMEAASS